MIAAIAAPLALALLLSRGPQESPAAPPAADAKALAKQLRELRHEGRPVEALDRLRAAPRELKTDPRVVGERLQALLEAGRVAEAKALVQRLDLPEDRADEQPMTLTLAFARLAWQRGDADQAARLGESVRAQRPDNVDLRILDSQMHAAEERFAEAAALVADLADEVGERRLADLEADLALAQGQLFLGQDELLERTVDLLRAAADKASWRQDVRALLSRALCRGQRFEEAEALVREALPAAEGADAAELTYALGGVLRDTGRIEEARAAFEQVLSLSPDHRGADLALARILAREGQAAEAIARLEATLARQPNQIDTLLVLADLQDEAGDLPACEEALRRVLATKPNHLKALWLLSRVAARQGRMEEVDDLVARYEARKKQLEAR